MFKKVILSFFIIMLAVSFACCGVKKAEHTSWNRIAITDELDNAVHNALINVVSDNEEKAEHMLSVETHKIFAANKKGNSVTVYIYYHGSYLMSNGNPKKKEDFDGSDKCGHIVMFFDITDGNYSYRSIDEYELEGPDDEFLEENFPDDIIDTVNEYTDAVTDVSTKEYKEFWDKYNSQIDSYLESI